MSTQNTNVPTEKLFEIIGIQTVQLQIHQANNKQLLTENQRLAEQLKPCENTVRAEEG